MTNKELEEQLEELKTVLHSLVIPNPEGLTLRQLCFDYKDQEGEMIPYHKFNFSSVTALLKSMPDRIRMIGNLQDINSVTLFPVKSETTKHIIDLVQKQNKNRKKSRRTSNLRFPTLWRSPYVHPPANPPLSRSANSYRTNVYNQHNMSHYSRPNVQNSSAPHWQPLLPTPTLNMATPAVNQSYLSNTASNVTSLGEKFLNLRITKTLNKLNVQISQPMGSLPQTRSASDLRILNNSFSPRTLIPSNSANTVPIPNKLKENIRLMMSAPDIEEGFMLFNFEARYRHQFKESFDYKIYGFQTLTDCLQSIPDVLEMIPTGTKTFKLMPLKKPQMTESKSVPTTTTVITNGHSIAVITTTATSTTLTFVTTQSTMTKTTVSTTQRKMFTVPSSTKAISSQVANVATIEVKPVVYSLPIPKLDKSVDNQSVCSSKSNDSNVINNKAKQNFRTVLLFHENGINALDFASEYENYFKLKFDSRIWGFKSPRELFHGLPQIFAIEVNDSKEEILHDSRFKKFEKPKPIVKIDMNTKFLLRQIPDQIYARILRLIQMMSPLGLPLSDFVTAYNDKFDSIEPTLKQLRFSDAFHLFEVIKDEIPIVIKTIEGHKRAFIKSKEELSEWTVRQTRAAKFIVPITLVDTPSSIVLPGEHFRPMQLPEKFKAGNYEYVAVYISSAVNPHEIYVQFKGAEYHTALESLMFGLDFYDSPASDQWTVPFEFLYVGYPVVCRYPGDKNWHRARISRIHASDKRVVTVSYIDYGGTHVLDYKNLRLMKKEFLSLPVQALKVGLYGIKPILGNKASDWTASARDKLLRFSKPQYALACTLIEVRPDNHWVAICDTNTAVDVFLHLILVNDKHALLNEDMDKDSSQENQPNNVPNNSHNSIAQNNSYSNRPIAQINGF